MAQSSLAQDTNILHALMQDKELRFRWKRHAIVRMGERSITESDVKHVLTIGRITCFEIKSDTLYHVEGADLDGRPLRIVIAMDPGIVVIKVVTTIDLTQGEMK